MNSHKQNLNISRLFERIKVNLCKTGFSLFSPMTTLLTSDYSSSGGKSAPRRIPSDRQAETLAQQAVELEEMKKKKYTKEEKEQLIKEIYKTIENKDEE